MWVLGFVCLFVQTFHDPKKGGDNSEAAREKLLPSQI